MWGIWAMPEEPLEVHGQWPEKDAVFFDITEVKVGFSVLELTAAGIHTFSKFG